MLARAGGSRSHQYNPPQAAHLTFWGVRTCLWGGGISKPHQNAPPPSRPWGVKTSRPTRQPPIRPSGGAGPSHQEPQIIFWGVETSRPYPPLEPQMNFGGSRQGSPRKFRTLLLREGGAGRHIASARRVDPPEGPTGFWRGDPDPPEGPYPGVPGRYVSLSMSFSLTARHGHLHPPLPNTILLIYRLMDCLLIAC